MGKLGYLISYELVKASSHIKYSCSDIPMAFVTQDNHEIALDQLMLIIFSDESRSLESPRTDNELGLYHKVRAQLFCAGKNFKKRWVNIVLRLLPRNSFHEAFGCPHIECNVLESHENPLRAK